MLCLLCVSSIFIVRISSCLIWDQSSTTRIRFFVRVTLDLRLRYSRELCKLDTTFMINLTMIFLLLPRWDPCRSHLSVSIRWRNRLKLLLSIEWLSDWVTEWLCDCVTLWLCDFVTVWLFDWVTELLCDFVTVWLCDCET